MMARMTVGYRVALGIGGLLLVCGGALAQEEAVVVEPFDSLEGWQVAWTGHAEGEAAVSEGVLHVEAGYDEDTEREGHSRLTMTRPFGEAQDFSRFTGLRVRLRLLRALDTSLWVHLLEAKGVRYRCNTFAKMSAVGEEQTLLTRFDTDSSWDFESSSDDNQQLDLDAVVGLRLMMGIPEAADGAFEIDEIALYAEPPEPTTNLIWLKSDGGAIKLLPPETKLPAPVSFDVTIGKLEPDVAALQLKWQASDAWKRTVAEGAVELKRAGEHSAPVKIEFDAPGYTEVDLRLLDGNEELRQKTFCLAALPSPAPDDVTPREESIFGMWPGGYGTWIKLGVKWARTYCQPWDFEPQEDGSYKYVRTDQDGKPLPFAPNLEPGLNYICFFRGMPKWLSSRPERVDFHKFPPTDWDEYARFVSHYVDLMKDRIRVWEVWNEPVPYAYWMGTIDEVVKLHEVTYKAIKRAQPDSIVLGPCPYRIRLPFTEEFFELGGGQWIDAVVVHAYMKQPDPQFIEDLQWLQWVLEDHDLEKDIWITEVGWDTRRHTELQQANYLVQTYAIALQEGVHTITWHMNWDYDDTMMRGGHGLLRNNHQPKPGLAAYAMAIRTLEGATPEGTLSGRDRPEEDRPAVVYQFRKDGRRIWVVWARRHCLWRPPCEKWEVRDVFGTPKPPDRHDPNAGGLYDLTESPIYGFELG